MEQVRVGVLGCAEIARRRLLPAMAAHPDIDVVAVASRDPATAEAVAGGYGARPVTGYRAVLDDPAVDAVYVPLPAALHEEWTEAALRAGKHVLAEKPLTLDPAAARRLHALADANGLALVENVMFVHHGQHAVVRALVDSGRIGEPRAFHASFTVPRRPDGDIRYDPGLGGGSLNDAGVYPVRAAVHLLGRELTVLGATLTGDPVDLSGAALLCTPAGVVAALTFGLDHAYRCDYEIHGSRGRITVDRAFTPPADLAPRIVLTTHDGTETVDCAPEDQVANSLSAFVDAIRTGRSPGLADCLAQSDLLAAVRTASRSGGIAATPSPRGQGRHCSGELRGARQRGHLR